MPIGVIINELSVVIGGILGALMGHKLSPKFKADITLVFSVCSMGMGISTIGLMENNRRCRCNAESDQQIYQEFKF